MNITNCDSKSTSSSICFMDALGLVFIALKLTGVIDWSWWLVLLPIYAWIPVVIAILFFAWLLSMR